MMPNFQQTYNYVLSHPGVSDGKYRGYNRCAKEMLARDFVKRDEMLPETLQFYLKVVDIEIETGAVHKGVWHIEGLPEEQIIATGIYYLDCPLKSKIIYKRDYTCIEEDFLFACIGQDVPSTYDKALRHSYLPLGEVTITGRSMLFFPNTHIHKVQPIFNDTSNVVHRQCVVFFMVDPKVTLPDWDSVDTSTLINTKDHPEILKENMTDRMMYKGTINPREINFCEH
jgi:hypothetical protein